MLIFLLSISNERDHSIIIHIYNSYHEDMLRFAKFRLKKTECSNHTIDAEDVVQESFIRIIKYLKCINLDAQDQMLRAYLFTIVANVINDFTSKDDFTENIDDHIDTLESDDNFIKKLLIKERYNAVFSAIEQLDEVYKITLTYKYHKGMKIKDIADVMGVSEQTVKNRLSRGRDQLLGILHTGGDKNG